MKPRDTKEKSTGNDPDTRSLHLRNFPQELLKRLKAKAALEGKQLYKLCIELLTKGVKK